MRPIYWPCLLSFDRLGARYPIVSRYIQYLSTLIQSSVRPFVSTSMSPSEQKALFTWVNFHFISSSIINVVIPYKQTQGPERPDVPALLNKHLIFMTWAYDPGALLHILYWRTYE